MRITPTNKKNKFLILLVVGIIIVGAGISTILFITSSNSHSGPSKKQEIASNDERKESINAKQRDIDNKGQTGSDPAPAPSPIPGSSKSSVLVEIPSAIQAGPSLHISSFIQTITNTGTCTLTLSSEGRSSYTASAGVQPLASSSTCKGFDVPLSQLSAGIWTATIQYSSDTLQGSASKQVAVQ